MIEKVLSNVKVARISILHTPRHDPDDENKKHIMGARLILKKGESKDFIENHANIIAKGKVKSKEYQESINFFMKGLFDEVILEDNEFDIQEIEVTSGYIATDFGFQEKDDIFVYGLKDMKQFDRFLLYLPQTSIGISFVKGIKGTEIGILQSIIFEKSNFTLEQAQTWTKSHIKNLSQGEKEGIEMDEQAIKKLVTDTITPILDAKFDTINQKISEHDKFIEMKKGEPAPEPSKPDERIDVLLKGQKEILDRVGILESKPQPSIQNPAPAATLTDLLKGQGVKAGNLRVVDAGNGLEFPFNLKFVANEGGN